MLVELRKLRAKDKSRATYISCLQNKGVLGKYASEQGYACYETKEYDHYKATTKVGRPLKGVVKGE